MSKSSKLEEYLKQATENIENDRSAAHILLMKIMTEIQKQPDKHIHSELGEVAAKYLETLQRSNEQLVKIAAIVQKTVGNTNGGLSGEEKEEIFDAIKEG